MGNGNKEKTEHADYQIDKASVIPLEHECDPMLCRECGSCCEAHDVWVDEAERRRILRWGRRAVERFDFLPAGLCAGLGPFRQLGSDLYVMEAGEDGICVWAYRGQYDEVLCVLHTIALDSGVSPAEAKPRGCTLWPLCISGTEPPVVAVQPGAQKYPCNTIVPERGTLHPGTKMVLLECLKALRD
ncbi:MAG: hypothetical protein ACOC0A_04990 [Planctomycetota bacterium]